MCVALFIETFENSTTQVEWNFAYWKVGETVKLKLTFAANSPLNICSAGCINKVESLIYLTHALIQFWNLREKKVKLCFLNIYCLCNSNYAKLIHLCNKDIACKN